MDAGGLTSSGLTALLLRRIETYDRSGPRLNSVLEINPDAVERADVLDRERAASGARGPLHGVPVLLKDNIATADRLHTSAGSLALAGCLAARDAFLVTRLRAAGAVILGKANMTEWANYMTTGMPAGYSSRGGQVVNPYDARLTPGGSSSGSAVAVAAGLCTVAVGTETSGSILSPAHYNSVVGIKPTVGLVSRDGIIPIAATQDTAGPLARTVEDAAILLSAMTGVDPRDRATRGSRPHAHADYRRFLDAGGLAGARIGVPRAFYMDTLEPRERPVIEDALRALARLGATVVDPADIATARETADFRSDVMLYEFKRDLNRCLRGLGASAGVRSLRELIRFNESRPREMLRHGQILLLAAQAAAGVRSSAYTRSRAEDIRLSRTEGIDPVLERHGLDALVFGGRSGAAIGAKAGYPSVIVPAGYTSEGAPVGLTFLGRAWSEPTLLRLAHAFEHATRHRRTPAAVAE
ncbi:MAG TPA: amidase family protein [Candidatus Limnocylindria bacterium]|nr:amidase family protein [Candidatus Limnocylindria bacterium]